jgi:hypothetical protein
VQPEGYDQQEVAPRPQGRRWRPLAALCAALVVGFLAERWLGAGLSIAGGLAYALCIGLAWFGATGLGRDESLPSCPLSGHRPDRLRSLLWLAPAVLLALVTAAIVAGGRASSRVDLALWCASMVALLVPVVRRSGTAIASPEALDTAAPGDSPIGSSAESPPRSRRLEIGLVVVVLLVAAAIRIVELERFPLVVHNDEANCGLMAQQILSEWRSGEVRWFAPRDFYGFPTLGFVPSALCQALFPPNLFGHRLANVLLSLAALVCLYLLLRDTVGWQAAVAGLWLGAVGHFSVHFSRSGIHSGHAGFLTIACAWLLWRGLRTNRRYWFVAAGAAIACCALTYHAALVVPLWLGLSVGLAWFISPRLRARYTSNLVLTAVTVVVVLAPMIGTWAAHPESFISRSGSMVFASDPGSVRHMKAGFGEDYLPALLKHNLGRALQLFSSTGDSNLQYGYQQGGMLDDLSAVLLAAGLGVGLAWRRRRQVWPVLIGLGLTWLLGAVLTMDAVQYSRVAGLMLLVCVPQAWLVAALLAAADLAGGRVALRVAAAALAIALAWVGWVNFDLYFVRHDRASPPAEVQRTVIARDARDDGPSTVTLVSSADLQTDFDHQAYAFVAAGRRVEAFTDPEQVVVPPDGAYSRIVVVLGENETALRERLMRRFPGARLEHRRVRWYPVEPLFDRLVIAPEDAAQRP